MKIFISGGCKNGKSTYAQELAVKQKTEGLPLYYVATMEPVDGEDEARIQRHRKEREGLSFETVEQPKNIMDLLIKSNCKGSFLIDSTTALLANEMFQGGIINDGIVEKIGKELEEVISQLDHVVIVSDYIFSNIEDFSKETKQYQRNLAYLDKICAKNCDVVLEICFGNQIIHKGGNEYEALMERI